MSRPSGGASRASYAELRDQLGAVAVGRDRRADRRPAVRRRPAARLRARAAPRARRHVQAGRREGGRGRRLLHGKVSRATEGLVADAAAAHWATSNDFADALEQLAIEALTMAAQYGGTLDDLEDDLFRFGRVVSAQTGAAVRADRADHHGREDVAAGQPAVEQGQRALAEPDHPAAHPPARPLAAGGARRRRRHRRATAGAAHRGGTGRHGAVGGAAAAAT